MNNKPDLAKGSYYNNPTYDQPPTSNRTVEYMENYPSYAYSNIWPKEITHFKSSFMNVQTHIERISLISCHHTISWVNVWWM